MKLNKKKVNKIIKQKELNLPSVLVAKNVDIGTRRVNQIYQIYRETDKIPEISRLRRPRKEISKEERELVIDAYNQHRLGARLLEKVIKVKYNNHIPHNRIHMILLEEGCAIPNKNKQKRRKPWIRYEREHSLSAGHMDWMEDPITHKQVCAVLDDASRKILSGGEFNNATAENSIKLVKEVIKKYDSIMKIREIITDHGTQFCANTLDKGGSAEHSFELFLHKEGIKHIKCRYKHPQSNGKIERWFQEYRRHRHRFQCFKEFIEWYNNRPHGSLELKWAECPNEAFGRKMPPECLLKLFFRMCD